MTEIEITEHYNSIWGKYAESTFKEILLRGHAFQYDEDEKESDLLFIGINPSFNKTDEIRNYVFSKKADVKYINAFWNVQRDLEKEPHLLTNIKWTHIDILVHKHTNQKYVDSILREPLGANFVYELVMVARQRIINIRPKVIVVCNTKSKELMGKNRFRDNDGCDQGVWMDFQYEFDYEYGTFKINNVPELKNTHVLFSSMLSGQGILDSGSRERLIWQIARVLKK